MEFSLSVLSMISRFPFRTKSLKTYPLFPTGHLSSVAFINSWHNATWYYNQMSSNASSCPRHPSRPIAHSPPSPLLSPTSFATASSKLRTRQPRGCLQWGCTIPRSSTVCLHLMSGVPHCIPPIAIWDLTTCFQPQIHDERELFSKTICLYCDLAFNCSSRTITTGSPNILWFTRWGGDVLNHFGVSAPLWA